MFAYVLVVNGVFVVCNWLNEQPTILLLAALISVIYYARRATQEKAPLGWAKLASGEAPHQLLYLLWLYYFPKDVYIYYVPLALSTIGKLILLLNAKSEDTLEKAQELILFQTKCEAFILGYLLIRMLGFEFMSAVEFLSFGLLVKLKYSFYYPSQKAFLELHFSFDNLTRLWGFRPLYHLFYMGINVFSSTYGKDRELGY